MTNDDLLEPSKYEKKAELALMEGNLPDAMKWQMKADEARLEHGDDG